MASEVRSFAVSVPAGTAASSPQVTDLAMPSRVVRSVRVRIPPGPSGLVGWALGAAGVKVLPWGAGEWIIADDEVIEWALDRQITSGAWQLQAYNTGTYAHTLYLVFLLDPVGLGAIDAPLQPLTITP